MLPRKLSHDYFLISGIDRRLEKFENMFTLPYGVSYNNFFLDDEKTVVFDGSDQATAAEYLQALDTLLAGRSLDVMICQHVEPDHTASLQQVLKKYPTCQVYASALAIKFLQQFSQDDFDWTSRTVVIKDGDSLCTGKHTLHFLQAQNVHWPEVMVTYDEASGTLLSADAFGSFGAPAGYIYADQVNFERDWLPDMRRYYTNIVGRQGRAVQNLLTKAEELEIKQIYPVHGLLFRTPESIAYAIDKYRHWANYQAEEKGTVIIYGSLYNHSKEMADTLAMYLAEQEAGAIQVYDVSKTNYSHLVADCFRYSQVVFICNNYNTELYPPMDAFLRELVMLNWGNHNYSLLGSKTWGGRGLKIADDILSKQSDLRKIGEDYTITSSLGQADLEHVESLARAIAAAMQD